EGRIIGRGHNRRLQQGSAVLHGEMDALERAGRQPASVYRESVIYTTLSPCAMCTGAILLYGIPRVVVGEHDTFLGEADLLSSCARRACAWTCFTVRGPWPGWRSSSRRVPRSGPRNSGAKQPCRRPPRALVVKLRGQPSRLTWVCHELLENSSRSARRGRLAR